MCKLLYIPNGEIIYPFDIISVGSERAVRQLIRNLCCEDDTLDWYKIRYNMPTDCILVKEEFEIIYD